MTDLPPRPTPPELPQYVLDPLEKQSPDRLEKAAEYARALAAWKRQKRQYELEQCIQAEAVDDDELEQLEERDFSTNPDEYEGVPSNGAYITVKETKPQYFYYYWQWREGGTWKNQYIAPVDPKD